MRLSSNALTKVLASSSTLGEKIAVPAYDRSLLTPGILHIGLGNFHRAHMAAYMDDLFNLTADKNSPASHPFDPSWGIVGAGILSFDQAKRDLLEPQDWLQTLVQRDADSTKASVLGSMIDFLPVNVDAIQEALAPDKGIKIVSMTITEGGYFLNDGAFDPKNPDIQHDIQHPDSPKTVFGIIVKALKQRRAAKAIPFTVLSCDNIPHNGEVAKSVVVGLAAAQPDGDSLTEWIEANVGFPNAMVDRITPASTKEQREFVASHYGGLEDASPVFCEPFRQWVLEDTFSAAGRPPLDILENVQFVSDVKPFEVMKIRILNGGHASLCYPSALLGLEFVHEAMEHPTISAFLNALECNEIIPTVPPVPNTDLTEYWKIIGHRFSNPTLMDTINRNCYDGASRQPKFIVPVIDENLKANRAVDGLALVSAMWCRYCQGKTEAGTVIAPNDPQWDRLHALALQAKDGGDPSVWLTGLADVYGAVGSDPALVESFGKAMSSLQALGVEDAMKQYVEQHEATK